MYYYSSNMNKNDRARGRTRVVGGGDRLLNRWATAAPGLPLCITTAYHHYSVVVLCITTVYYYCVLPQCTVYYYCVLPLRITTAHHYSALCCTAVVCYYCVLLLCIATAYYYCVLPQQQHEQN